MTPKSAVFLDLHKRRMTDPRRIMPVERLKHLDHGMLGERMKPALNEIIDALLFKIEGNGRVDRGDIISSRSGFCIPPQPLRTLQI
jgi:hypothetical protein